jgi:hypothetical protein
MHDSEKPDVSPVCRVTLRELQRSLEQVDALQSLELQHLQLRIQRAVELSRPLGAPDLSRVPDCVVSPRRAA